MNDNPLKRTPLYPVYADRSGVKLVDFGGWDMPVQFSDGILAEHRAVREAVGVFDVSHMGEIAVEGRDAEAFLDFLLTNRIRGAEPGRCIYSPMCRPDGGTVDDLLVYVLDDGVYLLVVNAANTDTDFDWISRWADSAFPGLRVENRSDEWALLALQGPGATALLRPLCRDFDPDGIPTYRHAGRRQVAGIEVLISRTGYTGEDGYELYCSPGDAGTLWTALEDAGAAPCGLGARDVLRLEARLPLYGHELSADISPLEAGLAPFVKLDKEDFVGREALAAMKAEGLPRRLYGLEMTEPGVAREGYRVLADDSEQPRLLGRITSGGRSPVRGSFIALALLDRGSVQVGDRVQVEIRGRLRAAEVVKTPFYRRAT